MLKAQWPLVPGSLLSKYCLLTKNVTTQIETFRFWQLLSFSNKMENKDTLLVKCFGERSLTR